MALDSSRFLVTKDIAIRSGFINSRYRIADGRFVLDNKDLSCVRFTVEEYISGLEGVEKVDDETAQRLIAENGYQIGPEEESQPDVETDGNDESNTTEEDAETVNNDGEDVVNEEINETNE